MPTYEFRLPNITTKRSPLFGIPKGTFGRGAQIPRAIILHSLKIPLDSYYSQVTHPEYLLYRDRAEPIHPSLHYAVGYDGETHQYVMDADVAWGLIDYERTAFPTPFPEGDWDLLDDYPDVRPDLYSIHIALESGEIDDAVPITQAALKSLARLVAWVCYTYEIDCDADHVVTHNIVDTQFVGECVTPDFPYAQIMAAAQAIIAQGGELDPVFEPEPILEEFFGPFTVGISHVSSAAYIIS